MLVLFSFSVFLLGCCRHLALSSPTLGIWNACNLSKGFTSALLARKTGEMLMRIIPCRLNMQAAHAHATMQKRRIYISKPMIMQRHKRGDKHFG